MTCYSGPGGSEEPSALLTQLRQLWESAVAQGSLSDGDVTEFRRLLGRGGASWFVSSTVSVSRPLPLPPAPGAWEAGLCVGEDRSCSGFWWVDCFL